jgi:5-(carboxyamino)imidazole ribonucleotide synthase
MKQTIWVLGSGQLGSMLKQAGNPINLDVKPIGIEADNVPELAADDIVTAEQELWPDTAATQVLSSHKHFINSAVFGRLADRLTQKQLLDELQLATAPWQHVTAETEAAALHKSYGARVLLKRRTGGYDGKGQHWLDNQSDELSKQNIPDDWREAAIAEQGVDFDEEISLVAARDKAGLLYFYPLALNHHVNGVLTASVSGLARLIQYQQQAEQMLGAILTELDYVGVMAMECFRVGDQLLINELAPRVHNSGHWSQAGASINQFEAHLRCIAGLPMTQPVAKAQTVMINLLGTDWNPQWLAIPIAEVYWYRKSTRPGRKLGHINLCNASEQLLSDSLAQLEAALPEWYSAVLKWTMEALSQGKA